MMDFSKLEKLMKAFASSTRLEIIDCIQMGITNPGNIAITINKHRSTVENHLGILLEADVVKKIQTKSKKGVPGTTYVLQKNANVLMATIKHLAKENQ
ncbi:MAG: helix-turn-helix transcriptional regulator [Candidatus Heimdallarchaeota archaeon]|nr:helix-turn-helix transcriptional regulator [Candidatus Heimdallarchaeota archaeon]MBY8995629.1 helix-turn-helix transcriptional regulator [Candidatus Heimdallarchaeota archaeon]